MDALEQRVRRMEDLAEIQRLQARYARLADRGWPAAGADGDALAGLFTEDGIWSSPRVGTFEGRRAIAENLGRGTMSFSVHLIMNPEIDVDGDEATGAWRALFALTTAAGQAMWGAGAYQVRYRRTPEGWRIAHLRTESAFMTPYETSWAAAQGGGRS